MLLYIEFNGLYIGLLLGGFITLMITTITLKASRAQREDYQKIPVQKGHQTYDSGYSRSGNYRHDRRDNRRSSDSLKGVLFFIGLTWVIVAFAPDNTTQPYGFKQEESISVAYTHGEDQSNPTPSVNNSAKYPTNTREEDAEYEGPQPVFVSTTDIPPNYVYETSGSDEQGEQSTGITTNYFIQVGAFSFRETAASVANKWYNTLSTNADVVIADENDGIYKVWIGVFDEITGAREFKRYAGLPRDALIKNGKGAALSFDF